MVLSLLLNASVPDQSDNICNKVFRNPRARGERGRRRKEMRGKGKGRAPGLLTSPRTPAPGSRPCQTSPVIIRDAELFVSLALNRSRTGYTSTNPASAEGEGLRRGSAQPRPSASAWGWNTRKSIWAMCIWSYMTFIGDRWGHLLYRSNIAPFSSVLIPFSLLINL